MGGITTNPSSTTKGKIAERIAFDPFLPQQDIINEFIRDTINPDIDRGRTYYLGQVVGIIDPDDREIDQRDIFYSYSDNINRLTTNVDQKKLNKERKILLVHIPSFLTSPRISTSKLNYNNFTKIRVEYFDKVEIGNIVKIQFADKNSFYDPQVIGVEKDIKPKFISDETNIAKNKFKEYLQCKVTNLSLKTTVGDTNSRSLTMPAGGYSQALNEISYIFSDKYISGFKETLSTSQFGDLGKLIIKLQTLKAHPDVVSNFPAPANSTYKYTGEVFADKQYLLFAEEIIFSAVKNTENDNLRNKFFDYIKLDMDSRRSFTVIPVGNTFYLDINSDFLLNKNDKVLEDYIKISETLKETLTYTSFSGVSSGFPKNIIEQKNFVDKCDAKLAEDKTTYDLVFSNGKPQKSVPKSDLSVLTEFSKQQFISAKYLDTNYFKKLNSDIPTKIIKDTSGKMQSVEDNLRRITKFLERLKIQVENLESYPKNSNDVLVLPIQVYKKKPVQILKKKDSQHYYGLAFDIRIYLKSDNKIYQIPPEIVSLYCLLETVKEGEKIGQGIFRGKRYNHIEFTGNLSEEDQKQKVIFVSKLPDPIELLIEKITPGEARVAKLKEIVRQGNSYISPTTKELDPRFDLLTQ